MQLTRLISVLAIALFLGGNARAASGEIHAWTLLPQHDSITVCWLSSEIGNHVLIITSANIPPRSFRVAAGKAVGDYQLRTQVLNSLAPATNYQVSITPGNGAAVNLSFKTPPRLAVAGQNFQPLRFMILGDTRSGTKPFTRVINALSKQSAGSNNQLPAAFMIHLGDMIGTDESLPCTIKEFFEPAASTLQKLPLLPVKGNHEYGVPDFKPLMPLGAMRGPEAAAYDYSLDYGPVRIIVLDQYVPATSENRRMQWLASQLASAGEQWRLVCFHEPLYSRGYHDSNDKFRQLVEPYLLNGKVHAVFSGHNHRYERSVPQRGITYFTSGGGGSPLDPALPASNLLAASHICNHFLEVNVQKSQLTVTAWQVEKDGSQKELDRVVIKSTCAWPQKEVPLGNTEYLQSRNRFKTRIITICTVLLVLSVCARLIKMRNRNRIKQKL
jgi:Calcineurin-like phosphoesterase